MQGNSAVEAVDARWTRPEDEPRVFALISALAVEVGGEPPSRAEFSATFSRAFMPDGRFRFVLAERGGTPVACASLHVGFSTWRGRPTMEVHDVYIAPEARDGDVAARLLAFAEAHARHVGAVRMEARTRADERTTIALYEANGFRDASYVLLRKRI